MLLFLYWLRYTVLLVISSQIGKDYSRQVARANQLSFVEARSTLTARQAASLEKVNQSLDRDYRILTCLLRYSGGSKASLHALLRAHYAIIRFFYQLTSQLCPPLCRVLLLEKTSILRHFANAMGERTAANLTPR